MNADLDHLIQILSKLPGLGPRSGRRLALHIIKNRDGLLPSLVSALTRVGERIAQCTVCGNLDTNVPCGICTDARRDGGLLCVVEGIADVWALERAGFFKGRYHVLGGVLSALNGVTPQHLNIAALEGRIRREDVAPLSEVGECAPHPPVREVILALSATTEGVTTAHYLADLLKSYSVAVTAVAHGIPVGGELDYLDDGTLHAALQARRVLNEAPNP